MRTAAHAADDVLIEPAERGRHEAAEVSDGEQSQRNTDNSVQHCHDLAFSCLRRYVPVT